MPLEFDIPQDGAKKGREKPIPAATWELLLSVRFWIDERCGQMTRMYGVDFDRLVNWVVLRIIRYGCRYDPARGEPTTFAGRIIRSGVNQLLREDRRRRGRGVQPRGERTFHPIESDRHPIHQRADHRELPPPDSAAAIEGREDASELIPWLLAQLPPEDAALLRRRFGLGPWVARTNTQIAADLGLTRAGVELRVVKLLDRLRQSLGLDPHPRMTARKESYQRTAQKQKPAKKKARKKPATPHALTPARKPSPTRRTATGGTAPSCTR